MEQSLKSEVLCSFLSVPKYLMVQIFVETIAGVSNIRLSYSESDPVSKLANDISSRLPLSLQHRSAIVTRDGSLISKYSKVSDLTKDAGYVNLHLRLPLCGGKGGLGTTLRLQGGKMGKKKNSREGDYKNLDGIRLKIIAKMKRMDELIRSLPEQERERVRMKKEKLRKLVDMDVEKLVNDRAGKFDDTKYIEDAEKIMEDIKNDVDLLMESDEEDSDDSDDSDDDDDNDRDDKKDTERTNTGPSSSRNSKFAAFYDDEDE
ncbi:unnamed protein product [Kuraishia capsulata CBS 1993]|uniref:SDE2-like domain-containing protein n=1 Tax=Kuraishia capsulata CBS 1993 TaxID=1382522 RepID=W6MU81_9ASCO|nr:uncharacterized protein KUCA_T00004943001 [Kuraishia capsulata CBS 1993]CDK28957.1 unnamed protein product [Kuraishia capsulata CBS 1993]